MVARGSVPKATRRHFLGALPGLAGLSRIDAVGRARAAGEAFDVCVVGSGPAGAILACALVEAGMSTALLEGGHDAPMADPPPETTNTVEAVAEVLRYPVERTRWQGPGGTSSLWNGGSARLQPLDFAADNPYASAPWPIRYPEIERYYEAAERELFVCGGSPTRYSPPRSAPFRRAAFTPSSSRLIDRLRNAGVTAESNPLSSSHGEEGVRVAKTHLPRFRAAPGATYLPGHKVTSLVVGPGGAVESLEVDVGGQRRPIRAASYVLAGGGIETPRLLLLSRSPGFREGIGNAFGLVGRHFTEHLVVDLGAARVAGPPPPPGTGVISWQFYRDFKQGGLGGVILEFEAQESSVLRLSAVLEMKPEASNRVWLDTGRKDGRGLPTAAVSLVISENERRTLARLREVATELISKLGRPEPAVPERFAWCHHHMGTCRMGDDPRTSVVDRTLRVHGVPNLYVAGSAPFVTAGVGSPTLLIAALSLRLADHLRQTRGLRPQARLRS